MRRAAALSTTHCLPVGAACVDSVRLQRNLKGSASVAAQHPVHACQQSRNFCDYALGPAHTVHRWYIFIATALP